MLTYLAIAGRYKPRWVVWENVPGVHSSWSGDDAPSDLVPGERREATERSDFGSFLAGLAELGYGFAYRLLDAQYFGVAQRRRRVFVVGCLGDWRSAAAVLFERNSMSGHPAPRRQTRERVATTVTTSAGKCDHAGSVAGQLITGTLQANGKAAGSATQQDAESGLLVAQAFGGNNTGGPIDVATALNACASASGRMDFESETFIAGTLLGGARARGGYSHDDLPMVAHALRGEGFDASEDGTGRGTPLVPILAGALCKSSFSGGAGGRAEGAAVGHFLPTIAFDCKASGQSGFGIGEVASTMRAMGHAGSHRNGGGHQAVAYGADCFNAALTGDVAATMGTRGSSETASGPTVMQSMQVRRLTPRECERLQGFPDNYTDVPHRGKPAADGPRYKALGNSWAVPNVHWIGQRIALVDSLTRRLSP